MFYGIFSRFLVFYRVLWRFIAFLMRKINHTWIPMQYAYRCEDGRFLVSASCVTISTPISVPAVKQTVEDKKKLI